MEQPPLTLISILFCWWGFMLAGESGRECVSGWMDERDNTQEEESNDSKTSKLREESRER